MGWGSAAAKLLDEPVWVTSPDRSSQGVDLDEEGMLLEEVDALHSESEGESSQRTEGHDPGNRMFWAALLLEHTRACGWQIPSKIRSQPISLVSCCSGALSEATVLEDPCCVCVPAKAVALAASVPDYPHYLLPQRSYSGELRSAPDVSRLLTSTYGLDQPRSLGQGFGRVGNMRA